VKRHSQTVVSIGITTSRKKVSQSDLLIFKRVTGMNKKPITSILQQEST